MGDGFVAWLQSPAGTRVIDSVILPAVAILVAGVVAALVARAAVRALLRRADEEASATAVAALVESAGIAASWPAADRQERKRFSRLRVEADVRTRLLSRAGAALAAQWASLRIDALQRAAESGPVAAVEVDGVRERLLTWVEKPARAKRLFAADVERMTASAVATRRDPVAAAPKAERTDEPKAERPKKSKAEKKAATAATAAAAPEAADRVETTPTLDEPAEQEPGPVAEPQPAGAEAPVEEPPSTQPVTVQRHRLEPREIAAAVRLDRARLLREAETQEPAETDRSAPAQPDAEPAEPSSAPAAQAATGPQPRLQPPTEKPAWLDEYDDDADITQTMNLKTPPPVAASSVHDRTKSGDGIVPLDDRAGTGRR